MWIFYFILFQEWYRIEVVGSSKHSENSKTPIMIILFPSTFFFIDIYGGKGSGSIRENNSKRGCIKLFLCHRYRPLYYNEQITIHTLILFTIHRSGSLLQHHYVPVTVFYRRTGCLLQKVNQSFKFNKKGSFLFNFGDEGSDDSTT